MKILIILCIIAAILSLLLPVILFMLGADQKECECMAGHLGHITGRILRLIIFLLAIKYIINLF